ncbi:MAG: regulatory iron-sulfur-containing complex subunit RicT [Planctomycetota bacterium]
MVTNLNVLPNGGNGLNGHPEERCGNGLEKIHPTTAVRYGYMKNIGEFTHPPEMKFGCGLQVIIKTARGIEIGQQVSLTCSGCDKSVTREQIQTYIRNSGPEYYQLSNGRILREATPDDLREETHLRAGTVDKKEFCQAIADRLKLPLKVVECEHLFGGERVIFYFLAEGRVDFRSLVKELAGEYQTRIEMRQVGVRDEARLLADYETCGRECCCKIFLKTLRPVNMKMAKMQKATLDPSKVSGRCGRLKCCLRYEHVAYEELDRNLPALGTRVSTAHGDGVVVNRQILTQLLQIQAEDEGLITVAIEDVLGHEGDEVARKRQPEPTAASPIDPRDWGEEPLDDADADLADLPEKEAEPSGDESPAAKPGTDNVNLRRRRRRRRRGPGRPDAAGDPHEAPGAD